VQVAAKDSKLDRVESQMLDSYDNDKKVAVLARIQVRPDLHRTSGADGVWSECRPPSVVLPQQLPARGCS
jgi:hypothetical protein